MNWIIESWKRLAAIGRRGTLERGMNDEIRFHLDEQTEKNVKAGMSREDARRAALIRFGAMEAVKESARDEIRPALLEDSIRDLRHGVRLLWRSPGFTAAALVTLALGIGATSAIFSVVRTVMLEPLPYREPNRLVAIWETNRGGTLRNVIAPANFVAWRERSHTLEHLGMIGPASFSVMINGQPERIDGAALSADVFTALGVQPALGRAYTSEEDFGRGDGVIVLGHEFWQRRLAGRQDVLGLVLATDRGPRTVLGVMPAGFTVVGDKVDFMIPYAETIEQLRAVSGRGASYALARLGDNVSFEQAYSEMRSIYAQLEKEQPQLNARRTVMLFHLQDQMVGEIRPALYALIGAVVLVLLVACVNVANLLLARSAARERELAMRTALGARRARLIRQMLIESVVLAVAGGAAGVFVAALCHRGLLALVSDRIPVPRLDQMTLDLPVVGFTMAVALATGIAFGMVPALVATSQPADVVRETGRHGGGRRLHRALGILVVAEVALSLVLLAGAGLLMRSFVKLQASDTGFDAGSVLTASVQLPVTQYDDAKAATFVEDTLARISALPGVESAGASLCQPMPGSCIGTSFWRADRPRPAAGQATSAQIRPISPSFFKTLRIPQMSGRDFANSDTADSMPVAIISDSIAREQFQDGSPIGRRLRVAIDHISGREDVEWTIVGVVGNIKSSLDGPVRQTIYLPMAQRSVLGMKFFVRTAHDPLLLGPSIEAVVHAREPSVPVEVRTLETIIGGTIARPRAISVLVSVFALVALALAAVGVYGVMAYSVRERTKEIGVRMALGATTMAVFRLVIGQAVRLVAIGVVAGLIAAGLLTRVLTRLLFEVQPLDPWTFVGTAVVLLCVAALAAYVPARRGMRMAPVDALRTN